MTRTTVSILLIIPVLVYSYKLHNSRLSTKLVSSKHFVSTSSSDLINEKPKLNESLNINLDLQNAVQKKKTPIGSEPQFSIPDDSVIETPSQRATIAVHFGLFLYNLYLVAASLASAPITVMAASKFAAVALFSFILGDFATGVFHWSVDNYGSIKTPIFGSVCAAFQGHHATPWTITFRSFCNNLYKVAYGTIPALSLLAILPTSIVSLESRLFFTLFINWWLLSQEFHKWSHMRNPPKMVRFLQDMGLILSRKEHGLHHSEPFDSNYCILNGICNPMMDKIGFYKRLENIVYSLTGNKPKNWGSSDDDSKNNNNSNNNNNNNNNESDSNDISLQPVSAI